jgi:hypothetical protein
MTTEAVDVQLAPLWSGRTMSDECAAKLEAMAAEADREREAAIARESELLAAGGAIPGSLADLQAVTPNRDQAPFMRWEERNSRLVEQVASGAVPCCGEWRESGYYGWCSLLTRPNYLVQVGERELGPSMRVPIYERCSRCPRAEQQTRIGEWFSDLLVELDAICRGEIDV